MANSRRCRASRRASIFPVSDIDTSGMVKILMSDGDGYTETLWARRAESGANHFQLDNSPFYAYGVSYEDVVEAMPLERHEADGMFEFVRVIKRSGNRTLRFIFDDERIGTKSGDRILDAVVALGCSFEGMFGVTISVTVPVEADLNGVTAYLTGTGLQWEYADPTYEEVHGMPGRDATS